MGKILDPCSIAPFSGVQHEVLSPSFLLPLSSLSSPDPSSFFSFCSFPTEAERVSVEKMEDSGLWNSELQTTVCSSVLLFSVLS